MLQTPQCVGIKIYLGYSLVYAYDKRHFPLYELAESTMCRWSSIREIRLGAMAC